MLDNIAAITGIKPVFEQFDLADEALTADFFNRHPDLDGIIPVSYTHLDVYKRQVLTRIHHAYHAFQQVVNILEAACLLAIAVNSDILILQSLHDKIGNHASVVRMHFGPVGIKNADDLNPCLLYTSRCV